MEGDAHEIIPKFAANDEKFDRITMPLPESGIEFLDDVLSVCKKGSTIHYYAFNGENEMENAVKDVRLAIERNGWRMAAYTLTKVGQNAPRSWRVCVDATIG